MSAEFGKQILGENLFTKLWFVPRIGVCRSAEGPVPIPCNKSRVAVSKYCTYKQISVHTIFLRRILQIVAIGNMMEMNRRNRQINKWNQRRQSTEKIAEEEEEEERFARRMKMTQYSDR